MTVTPADLRRTLLARRAAARSAADERRAGAVRGVATGVAELVRQGLIAEAWLIGSAAWGGFGVRSDVDVVLLGLDPVHRARAEDLLSESVDVGVDVLRFEELDASFRERVLRRGVKLA